MCLPDPTGDHVRGCVLNPAGTPGTSHGETGSPGGGEPDADAQSLASTDSLLSVSTPAAGCAEGGGVSTGGGGATGAIAEHEATPTQQHVGTGSAAASGSTTPDDGSNAAVVSTVTTATWTQKLRQQKNWKKFAEAMSILPSYSGWQNISLAFPAHLHYCEVSGRRNIPTC